GGLPESDAARLLRRRTRIRAAAASYSCDALSLPPLMANKVVHFETGEVFRDWLMGNHANKDELWVGFYKRASGKRGITYAQALDEALCFGWIDGVRYSVNESSYKIRFTPRRSKSIWSRVNVRHVERLKKCGKMTDPGLRAFELRESQRTGTYAFEQE